MRKTLSTLAAFLFVFLFASAASVGSLQNIAKGLSRPTTELTAVMAMLQAPGLVKNPTKVEFDCPDHAVDTGHEMDIINAAGTVLQTLSLGDPAMVAGKVVAPINVQPIAFGAYTAKVRVVVQPASGPPVKSEDSGPSNVWERTAMQPVSVTLTR